MYSAVPTLAVTTRLQTEQERVKRQVVGSGENLKFCHEAAVAAMSMVVFTKQANYSACGEQSRVKQYMSCTSAVCRTRTQCKFCQVTLVYPGMHKRRARLMSRQSWKMGEDQARQIA